MEKTGFPITRRDFVKIGAVGATALSFGGMLSACSAERKADTAESKNASQVVVTMTAASEPEAGFDPLVAWGCGEHVHEPLIQSTLVTTNADLGFENDLATSYECSADGLEWTFTIRDDVKFTDGEPLTAEDVAFTIEGIANSASSQADLSMVESAVALDAHTVSVRLKKPFNALLYTLAVVGIVPKHCYGEGYGEHPVGSGRYMLESWDREQQVVLKANPDYYGDAPSMERVVVLFVGEDASLAAAKSGQADVAYTAATFASALPQGYSLLNCASVDSRGISLPCIPAGGSRQDRGVDYPAGNDVTCDAAVRRAINYAVDRQTMAENVLNGYGRTAYSVSDGMPWSSDDMRCETDFEKAKGMLSEAGWSAGDNGFLQKGGLRAAFDLYYPASDSVRQAIANDFKGQMASLGIDVSVKGTSWDEIYLHQFSDPVVWGWGSNSPTELFNLHCSSGSGNYACLDNPSVDAHFDQALACAEVEGSYAHWKQAQWDGQTGIAPQGDAPWVWLLNVDHLYFQREGLKVAEQKPHPHGHGWSLLNNVDKWSWE